MFTAAAVAETLQENNEEGVAGNWDNADEERVLAYAVNIQKEIYAFNENTHTVHAPVVTYTYTVTPASVENLTVTDETTDHESGTAVTAPVKPGLTAGLVVTTTTTEGAAGTAERATGTLVFNNDSEWDAKDTGDINTYNINLDFTGVGFEKPGVYRYKIEETISATSYDVIAMQDGNYNTIYLDVYVDGKMSVYGYVCMTGNASVDPSTGTKINGFVNGSTYDGSDKYFTYDLTLSKTVENDNYAKTNHAFPFTLSFFNAAGYTSTFTLDQVTGTGSTGLSNSAETLTGAPTDWNGVVLVKDGGDITIKGIPAGVAVEVYETNDVAGVTYTVATSVNNGTAVTDNNVISGNKPESAIQQQTKADYQSTKARIETDAIAENDAQTVAITNTLLLISPTGVTLRFAPYILILAAGIVLLMVSRRRKSNTRSNTHKKNNKRSRQVIKETGILTGASFLMFRNGMP